MQLCEQLWRERLIARGLPGGGEFSVGTCAGMLVPCQCVTESEPELNDGHCDWCCGAHRVAKSVYDAMTELRTLRAAMPTEEEREGLVLLAKRTRWFRTADNLHGWEVSALAALDKLTNGGA